MNLILASQSPRRRELLEKAGFEFSTFPVKVSEIIDENLTPEDAVTSLALQKAEACLDQHKHLKSVDNLILGADTMVVMGVKCLGKPQNFSEAAEYLRLLSGKVHRVITGMCLLNPDQGQSPSNVWAGCEISEVHFRQLSEEEIADYVQSGEPMDKAGAYAIQGGGSGFVSRLVGSWSNVVGLPIEKLESVLKERGWNVPRRKSL
jgi:septum formation protein